MQKYDEMHFSI